MEQLFLPFETKEAAPTYDPQTKSTSELVEELCSVKLSARSTDNLNALPLPLATRDELAQACPEIAGPLFGQLIIAIELGRRAAKKPSISDLEKRAISSTSSAISYCQERFRELTKQKKEEFHILTLDTKHHIIQTHQISIGTLNASLIHPREVFRPAIADAAAAIIGIHNHPSGDPTPSNEDRAVTERLSDAGKTLGIDFLDHIVVAECGAISIRDTGLSRR